jgi:L-ascorbate metabolism protein UlaG (beta-lactamase superfamily)
MPDTVHLSLGTRIETRFTTVDIVIPALAEFICDAAADLAAGSSLEDAMTAAAKRHPQAATAFDLEDGFALRDELMFPRETLPRDIRFKRGDARLALRLDIFLARDLRELLELVGRGTATAAELRASAAPPLDALIDALCDNAILGTRPEGVLEAPAAEPGITRLQHAGLLIRGREAGVLADPHLHSHYEPDHLGATFSRSEFDGLVDAIVISHGHLDHWHLPTLMTFPRDTLIVVPKVPRASMLSPDFARTLRALGFTRVVDPAWYDPPIVVGDLEIHVLPFFGEQPLVREAPREGLRNHGNTWVIRQESCTAWIVIDSGDDWAGRMADVAVEVECRFGAVDVLLSNLRPFPIADPLYITGGHYWLALTPEQLRRFASMSRDVVTLAPGGVAQLCDLAAVRQFLPYAHWWRDVGAPPDAEERELVARLRANLADRGVATEVIPWTVGSTYLARTQTLAR